VSISVCIKKTIADFCLDIAFEAADETLALLGASGCGKTLTLRAIAGLVKPDVGRIEVNGRVFFDSERGINLSARKRKCALLFQNYQLFPNLTVAANIAAGLPRGLDKPEAHQLVDTYLQRFDLKGFGKRYPLQLSGGQQQRVALARMMAARPPILMLDEPFSALDAHLKAALEQDLLQRFSEYQGSIILVSHDIDEACRFSDRIAIVDDGHIDQISPPGELIDHPQTLAAIKVSGVKNISAARKIAEHRLFAEDWGLALNSAAAVPDDVSHCAIRAFRLKPADGQSENVLVAQVLRCADSRFERQAVLSGACGSLLWNVDKLMVPDEQLPQPGQNVRIYLDPSDIYLVSH